MCSPEKQGARENYYLQKYLPLLNTTFSSSFSESAIYKSLNSKLAILSNTSDKVTGQPIPTFDPPTPYYFLIKKNNRGGRVYEINSKGIKKTFLKYNSITEVSFNEKRARGTLGIYIDTNVPFRNKLYYSKPIKNSFESTFNLVKTVCKDLKLDSNIAKELWVSDAQTLNLITGSSFPSKHQASITLGISRDVITYNIDSWKPEGVKKKYFLFSRQLNNKEIDKLLETTDMLISSNKIEVWAYDAKTLELIGDLPFSSSGELVLPEQVWQD